MLEYPTTDDDHVDEDGDDVDDDVDYDVCDDQ
jgi:hypothetical protein